MKQSDLMSIRHLDDIFSHRKKQWAWQNGLTVEESLRRLLDDPSYCEKFGSFLVRAAQRSQEMPIRLNQNLSAASLLDRRSR
jgi:hypothetical protein